MMVSLVLDIIDQSKYDDIGCSICQDELNLEVDGAGAIYVSESWRSGLFEIVTKQ